MSQKHSFELALISHIAEMNCFTFRKWSVLVFIERNFTHRIPENAFIFVFQK